MNLSPDCVKERFQFVRIEAAVAAHAAADVDGKGLDLVDGCDDITGSKINPGRPANHRKGYKGE